MRFSCLLLLVSLLLPSPAEAVELTLQNDVYGEVPNAADCQPGFVRNEAFAAVFVPEDDVGMYPMSLRRVMVQVVTPQELSLEGGGAASGDFRMYVWHDTGLDPEPGDELLNRQLTLQSGQREEIDLLADGLSIDSGYFRIGFEFLYEPTTGSLATVMDPCPGIDGSRGGDFGGGDNTIQAERNLIAAAGGGVGSFHRAWSADLGVTQNWVLRAVVDVPGGGGDGDADADGDGDADTDGDADADGDADLECDRATDCPPGRRCIGHQCIPTSCGVPADCGNGYDCVGGECQQFCAASDECPDPQVCNDDGYCEDPPSDAPDKAGCACRIGGADGALAGVGAAALVALLVARRRRRR